MATPFRRLPKWAKMEITKAYGTAIIIHGTHCLTIDGGTIIYDGEIVTREGDPEPEKETIRFWNLPMKIQCAIAGSLIYFLFGVRIDQIGKDNLQIVGGKAFYNGRKVTL